MESTDGIYHPYSLETLWLSSTPFEKELEFIRDTKTNMSQQCVLIMNKADWGTSVSSISIEDLPPLFSTGVAPSVILCPALGPHSSTEMFRKWRGCREEITNLAWKVQVVVILYLEGCATLEQRSGEMSVLRCLQGPLTKPLTLSYVDDSSSSGSRLDLGDFPHFSSTQHFWDSVIPEFQASSLEN